MNKTQLVDMYASNFCRLFPWGCEYSMSTIKILSYISFGENDYSKLEKRVKTWWQNVWFNKHINSFTVIMGDN